MGRLQRMLKRTSSVYPFNKTQSWDAATNAASTSKSQENLLRQRLGFDPLAIQTLARKDYVENIGLVVFRGFDLNASASTSAHEEELLNAFDSSNNTMGTGKRTPSWPSKAEDPIGSLELLIMQSESTNDKFLPREQRQAGESRPACARRMVRGHSSRPVSSLSLESLTSSPE